MRSYFITENITQSANKPKSKAKILGILIYPGFRNMGLKGL